MDFGKDCFNVKLSLTCFVMRLLACKFDFLVCFSELLECLSGSVLQSMLIVCKFAIAALQFLCTSMDSVDLVLCKRDEQTRQPAEMHIQTMMSTTSSTGK